MEVLPSIKREDQVRGNKEATLPMQPASTNVAMNAKGCRKRASTVEAIISQQA
jgi:hypothetical protein